jgi:hypothetical protein
MYDPYFWSSGSVESSDGSPSEGGKATPRKLANEESDQLIR